MPDNSAFLSELDSLLAEYNQADPVRELADFVKACFNRARMHRSSCGIDRAMFEGLSAVRGEYTPEERKAIGEDDPDIYAGITNTKVRAGRAWMTDILMNAMDKPWTIRPTPMPQLSAEAEDAVVDALMDEVMRAGGQINEDVRDAARRHKDLARRQIMKLANAAAARAEQRIEDELMEGGWKTAFHSFIMDLMQYPNAILKGPIKQRVRRLKWQENQLVPVEIDAYTVKRVNPFDFYPSPNSTTPQDGTYVIERMSMTQDELVACIDLDFFDSAAVRGAIARHPGGFKLPTVEDSERAALEQTPSDLHKTASNPDCTYDVLVYYGKIKGSMLVKHDIEADPQELVEVEVWVCDRYVLRAVRNPHVLGFRPFYTASFEALPGLFWGRSLPSLLHDIQRVCNATLRALARNLAYSAGPIGEYDANRLINEQAIDNVEPYRFYAVEADPYAPMRQNAIRFSQVPNVAAEMLRVYDHFMKQADDVSGIPAYVLGNPNIGGAGRTLGGLSMLMGNAAKGLKAIIAQVDERVIEPLITNYYAILMMDPEVDSALKVDASVVARGSSGILQRELSQARSLELLQLLTPYVQAGVLKPKPVQKMLRSVSRSLGFDPDDLGIDDPDLQAKIASLGASDMPSPVVSDADPATPLPELDGRSQPAPDPSRAEQLPPSPDVEGRA